jgi:L-ascorbate metabolism protein UlaG (beta-lactamase superfamily)
MIPMHYNTFRLGREPLDEPLSRLLQAAAAAGVSNRVVPLGEGESWIASEAVRQAASLEPAVAAV